MNNFNESIEKVIARFDGIGDKFPVDVRVALVGTLSSFLTDLKPRPCHILRKRRDEARKTLHSTLDKLHLFDNIKVIYLDEEMESKALILTMKRPERAIKRLEKILIGIKPEDALQKARILNNKACAHAWHGYSIEKAEEVLNEATKALGNYKGEDKVIKHIESNKKYLSEARDNLEHLLKQEVAYEDAHCP